MSAALRFEFLRTADRFGSVAEAWDALRDDAGATLFQSHAWLDAWWRSLSDTAPDRPLIALAWRGETLVAGMALAIRRRGRLRTLEWAAKEISDYCDAVVRPGPDARADLAALWAAVRREGGFDLAYLSHLQAGAAVAALAGRSGGLKANERREVNLRLVADGRGGDAWFDAQPKKARQNHRRSLAALGAPRMRLIGPHDSFDQSLDALIAMKRHWLERTGQSSAMLEGDAGTFRAAVAALARLGALRLYVLEGQDGTLLAGALNFVEGAAMRSFFAAYDESIERGSAGIALMVEYIKAAFDEGLVEIDFLCGAESYKHRMANRDHALTSLAGGRTWLGRAAIAADDLLRRWRSWQAKRSSRPDRVSEGREAQPA